MEQNLVFSFNNDNRKVLKLTPNIFIVLERVGPSTAILKFCNEVGVDIEIPNGFRVRDITNHELIKPIQNTNFFILVCSDDYKCEYEDVDVMTMINHRQWNILSPYIISLPK
jgi:hypothetical protein